MTLSLGNLPPFSKKRPGKRLGRGNGSGKGTYAARGRKGQKARSGGRTKAKPHSILRLALARQTPKLRGFRSLAGKPTVVNLETIGAHCAEGERVTVERLKAAGLVPVTAERVKVLGTSLEKKLTIEAHGFSLPAKAAIQKVGGQAIIIGRTQ